MNSAQGTGIALPSEGLVIYDGNCGFCKSMVSFACRHMQPGRAEFVASQSGLGFMMNSAAGTLDTASLLAEVVFISVAVTLVIAIVTMIERKWFRWRPN